MGIGKLLGVAFDVASEAVDFAELRRDLRIERQEHSETRRRLNAALTKLDQAELALEAYRLADREAKK